MRPAMALVMAAANAVARSEGRTASQCDRCAACNRQAMPAMH